MRALFVATAALLALLGVSWLLAPETMLSLWGAQGDQITIYMARRYAVLFFGYAVILWLSRTAPATPARDAILAGATVVAAAMALVSLFGVLTGTVGPAAWIAVVIEVALAASFGYFYLAPRRRAATA